MKTEFVITDDGSHTLFVPELNEHYHSTHGAINESMHVFINAGLHKALEGKQKINILELGFGTGLNVLLTFVEVKRKDCFVNYSSYEAYPLEEAIYSKLNYPELIQDNVKDIFLQMHKAPWTIEFQVSGNFILKKINDKIENFSEKSEKYDLIYFDAFAPDVQKELWTEELFKNLYNAMNLGGILVTYSAKGTVKRALKSAGFELENLPGPAGKREITRAWKRNIGLG
jgi:tRNA U34 5-methylaminomethyl-2-thiouridine-forming methyltransferase MnmC